LFLASFATAWLSGDYPLSVERSMDSHRHCSRLMSVIVNALARAVRRNLPAQTGVPDSCAASTKASVTGFAASARSFSVYPRRRFRASTRPRAQRANRCPFLPHLGV